ncbi:cystathionine beta-lyase [Brevundimonas sp.]|uniref:cystathionine beta-lyase n=1 Tax=Brevundimonas sp. TaxID=1871086 RepID=UPI0025EF8E4B|nr:cystathionine beta-lyase [Brevundimonas sp.]
MQDRTRLIAGATARPERRRAVNPSVTRATTLINARAADLRDESLGPVYGIDGVEVHQELRRALAGLEGAHAVSLAPTGLAAVTVALLAMVRPGDEVLATDACYGPTRRFLDRRLSRLGVTTRYYAPRATADDVAALITDKTRVLFMESPGTATFEIQDVPALCAIARERGLVSIVDNTWAAGLLFKPLSHGADLSLQALSKYVSGHSDVFGGSIACGSASVARAVATTIEDLGLFVSPDDAWLMLRGLRTLPVRIAEHGRSALAVAAWLESQLEVAKVFYPPLPSSPDHELWRRDFSGGSGLMGLVLKDATAPQAEAFLDALRLFGIGFSWGGFESLATYEDAQLAVRSDPPRLGGALVRLHVGLEVVADLIADLDQGLATLRR